ncbi:MAG TPA: GHKL domain-containing protein [Nitrospirae bacterium]|nr:GHKL domain-containing protein [Nitrospirota bacterium]
MKRYIYFFSLLITATIIIIVDNVITYRHSQIIAEDATKLHALGIATSLEAALKDYDFFKRRHNLFKEIINDGKWEGIAFIGLYSSDGKILLHSNENLIGRTIKDDIIKKTSLENKIIYEYLLLGTGEVVFTINLPIHTIKQANIPVLRVAIHTFQIERLKRLVQLKVSAMTVVLIIIWIFGIVLLINEKKAERLREKMLEKERFAHIGEMASVLAHEIRNPLGSIKGFAQYLFESTKDESRKEPLNIIVDESTRLERLTDELLLYAKPLELKLEPVDINVLLNDTIKKLSDDFKDINFSIRSQCVKLINSDRDKIIQILINLIDNARDAMENKGTVDIDIQDSKEGIMLTVRDTGKGIDESIKDRIFNPFFTTKTRGTGLGLSIVKKLVSLLDGSISIKNMMPNGVEVKVFIRDMKKP